MNYRKAADLKVEKRSPGRPVKKRLEKKELQRLYVEEGRSIRDIAKIQRCTKDIVYRSLQAYGIKRRSHIKESKLTSYKLSDLKARIKERGYRKAGEDLGMTGQALWKYLKKERFKK